MSNTYVTKLRELHEIELSSRCNLACKYCPHPVLERPKEDMSFETFWATLDLLRHFVRAGTQTEVSLTGIGEALLHPSFEMMLWHVRHAIGLRRPLVLATNGIAVTPEVARMLFEADVRVYVSLHRPELAKPAIDLLLNANVRVGTNHAFASDAIDWAGQVPVNAPMMAKRPCDYLRKGWGVVRVDGRITTCCMDAHTKHSFGSVFDEPRTLYLKTHALCNACNLSIPTELSTGGDEPWTGMSKSKSGFEGADSLQ